MENQVNTKNLLQKFGKLIQLDIKEVRDIYIAAIISGIIQLSLPLGIQAIISFVQAARWSTSIIVLIILVVCGVYVAGYLMVLQKKIIEKIQQKIYVRYAYNISNQIPKISIQSIQSHYLPEMINRFFETTSLQKSLSKILLEIPAAVLQITFGLILLSFYHPFFIFFSAILVVLLILIITLTFKRAIKTSFEESNYKYKLAAWIQELARVLKIFKYSRNTNFHLTKSDELVSGYLQARTAHFRILLIQFWSLIYFKVIITILMLSMGAYLLIKQQLTIGQFIASEIIIITVLNSIEKIIGTIDNVYDAITSIEKLDKITDKPVDIIGNIEFGLCPDDLTLYSVKDLSFSFIPNQPVLQHLNFEIKYFGKVTIMGQDGAGKSILLKLLSGMYDHVNGSILINNIPIQQYKTDSLRDKIGLLINKQDIFEGSIFDNITLGHDISTQTIYKIAKEIGIDDFLYQLPQGLSTHVLPLGNRLSTSTIEKIILLRILVHQYPILLLDEPWIRSSSISQESIIQYLLNLKHTTLIVVTDDERFASRSDTIIHLNKNGKIDFIGDWKQFILIKQNLN